MPRALLLSPHLDDAAFSCGATAAALASAGWSVTLVTAFTRSVPNPQGFALECQTSKGLPASVDYMKLRRAEDAAAAVAMGCESVQWWPLPEAPHRGYHSPAELFEPVRDDDRIDGLSERIEDTVASLQPDLIFLPQCWGRHVDHIQVVAAAGPILQKLGRQDAAVWWVDQPYAMRPDPVGPPASVAATWAGSAELAFTGDAAVTAAKLDACAAYGSQLGFQFGSEAAMRDRLAPQAERFQLDPNAWQKLSSVLEMGETSVVT